MRRLALLLGLVPAPVLADDLGLKVPPGFRVTLWADHTLANDIFTMALDEKGRVVVSGPGYIRRLEDTKGTGKADKATDIAETKTGAMGLLFADSVIDPQFHLYVVADGNIRHLTPAKGGDQFSEPIPDRLDKFPFSEHGAHAVKTGPDGKHYVIVGNNGQIRDHQIDQR